MIDTLNTLLGLRVDPKDLTFLQIALRSLIVFVAALIMVRMADRRFLAKMSPLDAILGFILASMLARAVNGSAAFFPTLGGGFVLVFIHKFIAALAFRFERFGDCVKGCPALAIKDGELKHDVLRANHISRKDLQEELRQEGKVESHTEVKIAYVERSGRLSVVPKSQ
jgi:uncharacterized membrane protein YcaP (DUF421 family)